MGVPSIPTTYTHNLRPQGVFDVDTSLSGGVDTNLSGGVETTLAGGVETTLAGGVDTNLSGTFNPVIGGSLQTIVSGNLETDNVLKLTGDANQPVSTDSKIEILNLPRFTLEDIKDMMKVRVRIPNYSNVCLKILGVELMSVCMGGESQIITEPYVPTQAEQCKVDCCEPDTRPFPQSGITEAEISDAAIGDTASTKK